MAGRKEAYTDCRAFSVRSLKQKNKKGKSKNQTNTKHIVKSTEDFCQ